MKKGIAMGLLALALWGALLYGLGRLPKPPSEKVPAVLPVETTALSQPAPTVPEETARTEAPETEPEEPVRPSTPMPEADPNYRLTAHHAFVYDCTAQSLRFTLGDMEDRVYPASLTKLFTAYVALLYLEPDTPVTCGEEISWVHPDSSTAWVAEGDTVAVERLIQGMMMQSGNDAAYAVAVAAGRAIAGDPECSARRALEVFMDEVNAQAQKLGLEGSHFVNPDGMQAYQHHTTPADLLKIALLVQQQPLLRHFTGLAKSHVVFENGRTHTYWNTNFLLHPDSRFYCADACGMKTGTTKAAGSCMIALFHNGEGYILIGVLGCPEHEDRFADALQLYALYGGADFQKLPE